MKEELKQIMFKVQQLSQKTVFSMPDDPKSKPSGIVRSTEDREWAKSALKKRIWPPDVN